MYDHSTLTGEQVSKDDIRVRYLGGHVVKPAGYPVNFVSSTTYNGSAPNFVGSEDAFEFDFTGASFEWRALGMGRTGNWSLEVDGVATNTVGYTSPGDNGGIYYHWVDLPPSNLPRRIRIVTPGQPFGGLVLDVGATAAAVPPQYPSNVVFIGDSITEGSVASAPWNIWATQAAYRLGLDQAILSGVGASGYLAHLTDRSPGYPDYTFRQRIQDVLKGIGDGPPDAVVIAGGINDVGYPADQVGAEALAYFQALRAGAPDMVIIVFSSWTDYNLYTPEQYAQRDAIFAAAVKVKGVYTVDVSGWVTTANRDLVFDGSKNGPHPVDAGHALYGQLGADAIRRIVQSLP